MLNWFKKQNINYNNPYFGIYISDEMMEHKRKICNYILNCDKKVIVLSDYALIYGVELNQFNGYFDMPLCGNMGLNGEKNMLESVKKLKDTIVLLPDKEKSIFENFQYVNRVRDYIQENYNKIGEIENFNIYIIQN